MAKSLGLLCRGDRLSFWLGNIIFISLLFFCSASLHPVDFVRDDSELIFGRTFRFHLNRLIRLRNGGQGDIVEGKRREHRFRLGIGLYGR